MTQDESKPSRSPERARPQVYATPRLRVYGALADITRASGNKSIMDGGTVNLMKRSAV